MKKFDCETNPSTTVTLSSGKSVTTVVTVRWIYDHNYGADADGNRGIGQWDIYDMIYVTPHVDDDGNELSPEEIVEAEQLLSDKAPGLEDPADREPGDDYDWRQEMEDDDRRYGNDDLS